jgi:hypothetical protein
MSAILELFGQAKHEDWRAVVEQQNCPFLAKKCVKTRKSSPETSIGTCLVAYGQFDAGIIICPHRLLERQQIFSDCLHLLNHQPGNQLHIVAEIAIPGGVVDYFLVSAKNQVVKDFVGIELQTLDTTGSLWSERQKFLQARGVDVAPEQPKSFGMNWKMTAKTILVQLHHKIETFEHLGKHLALVVQAPLMSYMRQEFDFSSLQTIRQEDSLHVHVYGLAQQLSLQERVSTNAAGIAQALGLQADAKIKLQTLQAQLQQKLSEKTLLRLL